MVKNGKLIQVDLETHKYLKKLKKELKIPISMIVRYSLIFAKEKLSKKNIAEKILNKEEKL